MNAGGPRTWPALRLALVRRAQDLAPLLAGAQLNGDLNRRLQYMEGLGLNSVIDRVVYRALLSYRKFPEDLLVGSGDGVNILHEFIVRRAF
jgi:hypothetical protein